jgi:hypothetical protein
MRDMSGLTGRDLTGLTGLMRDMSGLTGLTGGAGLTGRDLFFGIYWFLLWKPKCIILIINT